MAALKAAKITLAPPVQPTTEQENYDGYYDEELEEIRVPDRTAKQVGLDPPVSVALRDDSRPPADEGSLTLRFGAGEEHTIHRSQFALSDMGYFPVGLWFLLSDDRRLVVYGGYRDTSCSREPQVYSARLKKLATQGLNQAGLRAFSAGRFKKARKLFRRATRIAPAFRHAWLNRMFEAMVRGDKNEATLALEKVRTLPEGETRQPATVCSWPERTEPFEPVDYACSAIDADEFHRVGANPEGNLVAVRRVIREVSDDAFHSYAPILGRRHYGVQLFQCEIDGTCGQPITIYSPNGTSKKVARKRLARAKKNFSAKGIVFHDEVSVFEPFADEARITEIGIAAPLGPTRVYTDIGPAEVFRLPSGEALLVYRHRWCDERVTALELIDEDWLTALLKHADGVDGLNAGNPSLAAAALSDALKIRPDLDQARWDLALVRALGDDLEGAIRAVQGLSGPFRRISKKTLGACR